MDDLILLSRSLIALGLTLLLALLRLDAQSFIIFEVNKDNINCL